MELKQYSNSSYELFANCECIKRFEGDITYQIIPHDEWMHHVIITIKLFGVTVIHEIYRGNELNEVLILKEPCKIQYYDSRDYGELSSAIGIR